MPPDTLAAVFHALGLVLFGGGERVAIRLEGQEAQLGEETQGACEVGGVVVLNAIEVRYLSGALSHRKGFECLTDVRLEVLDILDAD